MTIVQTSEVSTKWIPCGSGLARFCARFWDDGRKLRKSLLAEARCPDFRSFHEVVILRFQFGSFLCSALGYGVKTSEVSTGRSPLPRLPKFPRSGYSPISVWLLSVPDSWIWGENFRSLCMAPNPQDATWHAPGAGHRRAQYVFTHSLRILCVVFAELRYTNPVTASDYSRCLDSRGLYT